MDVSCFSPSPNVHNLYFFFAPLTPFSPPSHLSSLSKFCPVRREVLLHRRRSSAAHPGLRSPGKSRTGGLGCRRAHRSLLVVGASTCSQPLKVVIVAVAVVTLTLVSLPYLISWGWKWKNDFMHVCHLSSLLVLHPFKYIMDQVVEGWALISGQFVKETSKEKACHSVENFTEISDASTNLKASVQSHKFDSSRPGPLIKEASDSPSAVVFRNKNFLTDSEVAIPSVLHSVYVTPPLHRVVQLSGFQTEAHQQNAECYLTIYETKGNAEPFRVNESHKQLDEIEYSDNECHEEDKFMNFRSLFKDSPREDQSVKMSSATLNGPENFACGPSLLGSNNVTSIIGDMNRHGSDLSSKNFYHNADNLNGRVPLASLKRDPFGKRKLRRNRGFANDSVKSSMHQNSHQDLAQLPSINGMKSNSKQTIPEEYSTYRSLLHVGRINDSLELLEAMERVDLLDMNKVYHAKFFEKCKTKKAVKAAFRFTKLIPNPTLSAFNMLMSVCASSQDFEGAFQVLQLVREAGLKADCKLYTTLISTCAKSGKVDAMFEVFHEMVNTKVEPNLHTYGALIDGCARAGQVAKAFGAYGIMRSKNVKPDRVVFNALITACGRSGALDRAFDVLTEMLSETQPIDPDHITVGALIKACMHAGQVDRAREVYRMIHEYQIKGTPEVYTIAVSSCSQSGDWKYACSVYNDMTTQGVVPDEMFLSALMGVAGHAGKLDAAFGVLHEAIAKGLKVGPIAYSSLMGACSNAKNWEKALELYEDIKSTNLNLTVSTINALITALCDGDQLQKALEVLFEMKGVGLRPNNITYSILLVAIEKSNDLEVGLMLLSQAKKDGVAPNLVMCRCLIAICLRRLNKACTLGESVLSLNSGRPYMDNKWTAMALLVYRETILAGVVPTGEVFSQLLGCLQFPRDSHLKERLSENLSIHSNTSKCFNPCTLIDGFGEYDPRASTLFEEAASLGIVPSVSFIESPIVIDAQSLLIQTTEVYILTVFKGLKHRLAAGAKLPNLTILLPTEKTHIHNLEGVKTLNIAGRISQTVGSLLRRLGIPFQGSESYGKIRISSLSMRRWFQPKHDSPLGGKLTEFIPSQSKLGKGIIYQQRDIRTGNLSLD